MWRTRPVSVTHKTHSRNTKQKTASADIRSERLKNLINAFDKANDYKLLEQPFSVEIVEVEPLEKFAILPRVEAVAMKTPHTPESLAIHIRDANGKTLVYTSDTGFDNSLGTFAGNVDLLVMECLFFKNKPVEKHLKLVEAMYLARQVKPKRIALTHLYPEWDAVDFQKEIAEFAPIFLETLSFLIFKYKKRSG